MAHTSTLKQGTARTALHLFWQHEGEFSDILSIHCLFIPQSTTYKHAYSYVSPGSDYNKTVQCGGTGWSTCCSLLEQRHAVGVYATEHELPATLTETSGN